MNKYTIAICLVLCCNLALAQPGPPATPIDGGLGVLLAGGLIYGLKSLRKLKKDQT